MAITVLHNGDIFDSVQGSVLAHHSLIYEDQLIKDILPSEKIKLDSQTRVIDVSHHFVMPGIIDAHMHIAQMPGLLDHYGHIQEIIKAIANLKACAQHGATTIVHMGGCRENVILRDNIQQGKLPGLSRLYLAGMVNATGGHVRGISADGPWQVRQAVRQMIHDNVDYIKTAASGGFMWKDRETWWEDYTCEELNALVSEAHSKGKRVAVHAHTQPGLNHAIDAGCDMITHGAMIDDEALTKLARSKLYYVPTLYITSEEVLNRSSLPDYMKARMTTAHPIHRAGVKKALQLNIPLALGTDGGPDAAAKEIAELVACGMTTSQALSTATYHTAQALGKTQAIGSLQPGCYADILIIDGNPLEDHLILQDTNKLALVIVNGVVASAGGVYKALY